MPVYEYRCRSCGKSVSRLFRSFSAVREFPCPHCRESELERTISKVTVLRGSNPSGDDTGALDFDSGFDDDDPRAAARMARSMAREMGEEFPAGYNELLDRMEAGETPDEAEFAAVDEAEGDALEESP